MVRELRPGKKSAIPNNAVSADNTLRGSHTPKHVVARTMKRVPRGNIPVRKRGFLFPGSVFIIGQVSSAAFALVCVPRAVNDGGLGWNGSPSG